MTTIAVDAHGHSFFTETELVQTGNPQRRIQAKNQDVSSWQMALAQPGHAQDFARPEGPQVIAVLSGNVALGVSNGESRTFARGDMVLLKDTTGQGHRLRVTGHEPCGMLLINLPGNGDFK
jgi:quercetin dioxygenase-like cupin family protein